jgi:hypothetical protein
MTCSWWTSVLMSCDMWVDSAYELWYITWVDRSCELWCMGGELMSCDTWVDSAYELWHVAGQGLWAVAWVDSAYELWCGWTVLMSWDTWVDNAYEKTLLMRSGWTVLMSCEVGEQSLWAVKWVDIPYELWCVVGQWADWLTGVISPAWVQDFGKVLSFVMFGMRYTYCQWQTSMIS